MSSSPPPAPHGPARKSGPSVCPVGGLEVRASLCELFRPVPGRLLAFVWGKVKIISL